MEVEEWCAHSALRVQHLHVPHAIVIHKPSELLPLWSHLKTEDVLVKIQVLGCNRAAVGGVIACKGFAATQKAVTKLLQSTVPTQEGSVAVTTVLVQEKIAICQCYAMVLDRDPITGVWQCYIHDTHRGSKHAMEGLWIDSLATNFQWTEKHRTSFTTMMHRLQKVITCYDVTRLTIDTLALTSVDTWVLLDVVMRVDPVMASHHPLLVQQPQHALYHIQPQRISGTIGCLADGKSLLSLMVQNLEHKQCLAGYSIYLTPYSTRHTLYKALKQLFTNPTVEVGLVALSRAPWVDMGLRTLLKNLQNNYRKFPIFLYGSGPYSTQMQQILRPYATLTTTLDEATHKAICAL